MTGIPGCGYSLSGQKACTKKKLNFAAQLFYTRFVKESSVSDDTNDRLYQRLSIAG